MQGKADKCQHRLDQLTGIFQPVLKSSSKPKLSKEGIQQPLFIEHPDTCECVICLDAVLHMIFIEYLASLSNYLTSVSRPEQSSQALEMAELVCESAESKMIRTLGRLNSILCGSEVPRDCSSKETKKKRGTNSAKGRKQKEDMAVTESSNSQFIFSRHHATLHCMNAKLLLQNGKVEKANTVLTEAMELLHRTENAVGVIPVQLLPIRASLLYLYGVTTLLCNKGSSGDVSVDCNWFSKTQLKSISSGNTIDMTDSMQGEEAELEVPRRGSSRRCRASKTVETSVGDNGKKKSSRAKGRGKSKKVEELHPECDESDVHQKPKGRSKRPKSSKATNPCDDKDDHVQGTIIINIFNLQMTVNSALPLPLNNVF